MYSILSLYNFYARIIRLLKENELKYKRINVIVYAINYL